MDFCGSWLVKKQHSTTQPSTPSNATGNATAMPKSKVVITTSIITRHHCHPQHRHDHHHRSHDVNSTKHQHQHHHRRQHHVNNDYLGLATELLVSTQDDVEFCRVRLCFSAGFSACMPWRFDAGNGIVTMRVVMEAE